LGKIYNKYYSDYDINLPTYYDKFKLCHTILARINQFVNTINGYLQDFPYPTIYGSHLHIDIAKKFYYVRGIKQILLFQKDIHLLKLINKVIFIVIMVAKPEVMFLVMKMAWKL
jgi:hypothetical protein